MRLPSKTEVEKATAEERQAQALEGLKLARKVDDVRLELVKEQNNLSKLKNETSKIIQAEIDTLLRTRDNLKNENDILTHHNSNLKAPFDEEWETIRQTRIGELDERYGELERERISLASEKAKVSSISGVLAKDAESTKFRLEEATVERLMAKEERQQADSILQNAKIEQAEIQSRIDAEHNQLTKKVEEIALQLRDIQVREAAIQKSARELARRERFINSKYKVLLNTQKALKQNG